MAHISPLKKLFRRQKALAGIGRLMDERERRIPQEVLLVAPPLYFMMRQADFYQHREAITALVKSAFGETEWSKAANPDAPLPDGVATVSGSRLP